MRVLLSVLASLFVWTAFSACGSDDGKDVDPCRGVVCPEGYDCRKGQCVFREEPEPIGCQSNNDCQFNSRGRLCELGTGRCVACLETAHCAEGRRCEVGVCVGEVCTANDDCRDPTPVCAEDGLACVECGEGVGCGEGRHCNAGVCVDEVCPSDEACAESDPTLPYCVEGSCGECRGEDGCSEGEICVEARCEPDPGCRGNSDCATSPDGQTCDVETGACVECLIDLGCHPSEQCVEQRCEARHCGSYQDCPTGSSCEEGACAPLGQCGSDLDCLADPRVAYCSTSSICVECVLDDQCGAGKECDAGKCRDQSGCAGDYQCLAGFVCSDGSCMACRTDEQCPVGVCVSGSCTDRALCATDAECAQGVCSGGSCVACSSDLHCKQGLWCEEGACVEAGCASNGDCGPGNVCDDGVCVDAGCVDDSFEEDGAPHLASPILLGTPVSRTLCPNDEDWFTFVSTGRNTLDVELSQAPQGAEVTLIWFDAGDERTQREQRAIDGRILVRRLPTAAAGRYYLRVRGVDGASGSYSLLAREGSGDCTDPFEPNDVWNRAVEVPIDTWLEGLTLCNQDFYTLEIPEGSMVRAYAFLADGQATISLLTGAGGNLAGAKSFPAPYLGGAVVAAYDGDDPAMTSLMLRLQPGAQQPSSYRLYIATVPKGACVEEPLLLEGEERARLQGVTLGYPEASEEGACHRLGLERSFRVEIAEPSRLIVSVDAPFPAVLALEESSCGSEKSCMPALEGGIGTLDLARVEPGSYTLVVGSTKEEAGPFDLAIRRTEFLEAPANDRCEAPTALPALGTATVQVSGSTSGASAAGASCNAFSPDVYYDFTLEEEARLVAELASSLPAALELLQAGCVSAIDCQLPGQGRKIDRTLPAGDYVLRVASTTGASMDFHLALTLPPMVSNNRCTAALPALGASTVVGDTTWADNDLSYPIETSCTGYYLEGSDVFYRIPLEAGQTLDATLLPDASYDAALYLIDGCDAPMCLMGSDKAGRGVEEKLRFQAPAAKDYFLVVDGGRGGGPFELIVDIE